MTKRIFRSSFFLAVTVLILSLAMISGVLYGYYSANQKSELKRELSLAVAGTEAGGLSYLSSVVREDIRLTWVSGSGSVLFDTQADPSTMENHAEREEIHAALAYGTGESTRYSATLTKKTQYCAERLSDGSVLRISADYTTFLAMLGRMWWPLLLILLLAAGISLLLASRLSKKIVRPLNELNLDCPLDNKTYDEISPLLLRLDQQQRQIREQIEELGEKRKEFLSVIRNMKEGLVLLGSNGKILSINPAAATFFHTREDCVGQDFLAVERGHEINHAIADAKQQGGAEVQVSRAGREYQLNVSRIRTEGKENGAVLLIFDITEKVCAEKNRQEFTANVSHELKTPLQAIMGSAELLENGMVRPEDEKTFVGNIRRESARLVTLIEDIIHLSQLDEGGDMPLETVDLYRLAEEELRSLRGVAEKRGIVMELVGEATSFVGVPGLLHEIVYNLCDNAIKYNKDGGHVTVTVGSDAWQVMLSVKDTGIGIPYEQQSRVFERFYRVDKSRSKETGGTGLGLSIVKHAVQYMHGHLMLESTPGVGTTVTVIFGRMAELADKPGQNRAES